MKFFLCLAMMTSTIQARAADNAPLLSATYLRCEYRVDPSGIDAKQPRLSWLLKSDAPDVPAQRQTAFQIVVASSEALLAKEQGDLWDSGKGASNQTSQIAYAGKPLTSRTHAFWKVRVWNGSDRPSAWSAAARWSMGLLDPGDWQARWIGYDTDSALDKAVTSSETLNLEGLSWIWSEQTVATKSDPREGIAAPGQEPAGARYFRKVITIPANEQIVKAHGVLAADNRFEIFVNGKSAGYSGDFRRATSVDFTHLLRAGENVIAIWAQNDSPGPAGLVGRLRIKLASQPSRIMDIDSDWLVSARKIDGWDTSIGTPGGDAFKPARIVAKFGDAPWGKIEVRKLHLPPPPCLRKQFELSKPIVQATVYASALGIYELHINGQRVGGEGLALHSDHFTPGWTEYAKRVRYQTYDVTPMLKPGANAVGAILGDGWFSGYFGFTGNRDLYGNQPRVIAQLEIEFADGSKQTIATGDSWRASYGPIREADLLMGCAYDANQEIAGWDTPGFDVSKWDRVAVSEKVAPRLEAQIGPTVQSIEEIKPQSISQPLPGVYVFDLGQNMVGWARLKMAAPKGARIVLRFAEMLNPDGTVYTTSLRGARATDTYISKGGAFMWEPSFTFHGFRYVEMTGVGSQPPLDAITGVVVHSRMQPTGSFECSNPLVNQLVHNIVWGQKGNYLEVPTDCPQRDERLGWTGDAQFFIATGAYNFDVAPFFSKWLIDLVDDSQSSDGAFASVAPDVLKGPYGATAWADAGIVCPYTIWRVYGDTRVIEQHYANMARYIDYLHRTSKDLIRGQGAFGDWVNLGGGASSEVIGTSYFEHVTRLMSEMAGAIGRDEDAKRYLKLADEIRAAFIRVFVTPDGKIKDSSQTGYALAFTMGLLPDEPKIQKLASDAFVEEIKRKDWHLATGFIGTPRLLPGLSRAGRDDIAYRLLLTESFPSWLYQVKLGATTMWERWDGWVPERGFQDPGMNSFNHYAFGSVGEFLYRTIGGIDTDGPGFRKIVIRPHVVEGLTFAKASYESINGTIESSWRIEGDQVKLDVTIPVNTTATVHLGDKKYLVESGSYSFTAPK